MLAFAFAAASTLLLATLAFTTLAFTTLAFTTASALLALSLSALFILLSASAAFSFLAGAWAVALLLGTSFQFLIVRDDEDTFLFDGCLLDFQGGLLCGGAAGTRALLSFG